MYKHIFTGNLPWHEWTIRDKQTYMGVIFHIQCQLALFLCPFKAQAVCSMNRNVCRFVFCVETTYLCFSGTKKCWSMLNTNHNTSVQVCLSLIVLVHNSRFPADKHVHKTHPSQSTTNEIPLYWYFKMHWLPFCYLDYTTTQWNTRKLKNVHTTM